MPLPLYIRQARRFLPRRHRDQERQQPKPKLLNRLHLRPEHATQHQFIRQVNVHFEHLRVYIYIYNLAEYICIYPISRPPQLFDTSRTLHEFHTCSPDRLLYEGGYVLADNGRYCTSKCEKNTCYTIENYIRPTTCDPSNVISNDQQQYLTRYGIFCTGIFFY